MAGTTPAVMHASHTQWIDAPRPAPEGTVLFAVGDLHGHADELIALQRIIAAEVEAHAAMRHQLVYLGDYIDRGPAIRRTLEVLQAERLRRDAVERVFLVGNHDQFLVELLNPDAEVDGAFITAWYDNGGQATMRDLGVEGYGRLLDTGRIPELREAVRAAAGPDLRAWLDALRPMHRAGDYVFVHAGIDPAVPLDAQDFADLLLMREPFLAGEDWPHRFCVIHGHSIEMPIVRPHRIGVDAGCHKNGALCAVQIAGERLRFVGVTSQAAYPWQDRLGGRQHEWVWEAAEALVLSPDA